MQSPLVPTDLGRLLLTKKFTLSSRPILRTLPAEKVSVIIQYHTEARLYPYLITRFIAGSFPSYFSHAEVTKKHNDGHQKYPNCLGQNPRNMFKIITIGDIFAR